MQRSVYSLPLPTNKVFAPTIIAAWEAADVDDEADEANGTDRVCETDGAGVLDEAVEAEVDDGADAAEEA